MRIVAIVSILGTMSVATAAPQDTSVGFNINFFGNSWNYGTTTLEVQCKTGSGSDEKVIGTSNSRTFSNGKGSPVQQWNGTVPSCNPGNHVQLTLVGLDQQLVSLGDALTVPADVSSGKFADWTTNMGPLSEEPDVTHEMFHG